MEQDMEMSCDEEVIKKMGNGIKKEYSQSLLNFAAGQRNKALIPVTFKKAHSKIKVKMTQPFGTDGIWIPKDVVK